MNKIKTNNSLLTWLTKYREWVLTSLTLIVLGLIVLGQLQRIQLSPSIAFYIHDLVLLFYLILLGFYFRKELSTWWRIDRLKQHLPLWLMIGWLVIGWGRAAVTGGDVVTGLLYTSRYIVYSAFLISLFKFQFLNVLIHGFSHIRTLHLMSTIAGTGMLIVGLLQYFLLPDTRFLHILGWDDHFYRLIGTQFDPNFMGMLLTLFFLLLEAATFINTPLKRFLQTVFSLGLAFTFSRSSYLSFGVAVLFLTFSEVFRGKTMASLKWVSMILILGIMISFAPKPTGEGVRLARTSTVTSRLDRTEQELTQMSLSDVLVGKGLFVPLNSTYATIEIESIPNHAWFTDNVIVNAFAAVGVLGLILTGFVLYRYIPIDLGNSLLIAATLAVFVHSLFNNTLLQPFVWLVFGMVFGILSTRKKY
jgi:hypothetical protein